MSLIKSNSIQIGQSSTATQNFTLSVPSSPDGTIKLARGNSGATTADIFSVNGSGAITGATISGATINSSTVNGGSITLGTAQTTTSGSNFDFTGLPSWIKKITIVLSNVSTSGANGNLPQIQLGTSSGIVTTGYEGYTWTGNTHNFAHSTGFNLVATGYDTSHFIVGHATLTTITGNVWVFSTVSGLRVGNTASCGGGTVSLSGALQTVRLTTGGGDTFDNGTINIMYEG